MFLKEYIVLPNEFIVETYYIIKYIVKDWTDKFWESFELTEEIATYAK
jgi:hypothetical protein